jgi:hypothetical protein
VKGAKKKRERNEDIWYGGIVAIGKEERTYKNVHLACGQHYAAMVT